MPILSMHDIVEGNACLIDFSHSFKLSDVQDIAVAERCTDIAQFLASIKGVPCNDLDIPWTSLVPDLTTTLLSFVRGPYSFEATQTFVRSTQLSVKQFLIRDIPGLD